MKSIIYSCQTLMKIVSSKRISEKASNIRFMNISPVGAKLFHTNRHIDIQTGRQTDGPTDASKLIITFRNFAKAPNKNHNNATECAFLWT
jgi:hypothetical protein